jgi:hypothetical protein
MAGLRPKKDLCAASQVLKLGVGSITEPLWLADFRQEARGNKLGTVSLLPGLDFGRSTLRT